MRHYQRKTDANHKQITAYLRRLNCHVIDLSAVGGGVPDLLILTPDRRLTDTSGNSPSSHTVYCDEQGGDESESDFC